MASRITIPARQGKAITLRCGQHVKVINTHSQRVVDTWTFNSAMLTGCMSMEHARTALGRIMVRVGDSLITNQRSPILMFARRAWTTGANTGALRLSPPTSFLLRFFLCRTSLCRRMVMYAPRWLSCTGRCQRSCVRMSLTTLILIMKCS